MKILFLAHLFPLPLDSGGKIKSYYTLKALTRRHEVQVLCFTRTDDERRLLPELEQICKVRAVNLERSPLRQVQDLAVSVLARKPFIISRDFRREMKAAFDSIVADFEPDVVHIDHLQMAQFVNFKSRYATVLDHHNVESMIIRRIAETPGSAPARLYAKVEWPKLQRYELDVCRSCSMVTTVSEEDKATLTKLDNRLHNVSSVPIGVDVDYFGTVVRNRTSRNVLSVGTMYWPPNVDSMLYFHREIWPRINREIAEATLTIAGQRPVPAIQALAADPTVAVTGYVEDVRDIARNCGVFIVPLRSGSGVRVKILNAMAMGLPIVSTKIGAEGLDIVPGEHMLIADKPEEFAQAVINVLKDPGLAEQLGRNSRQLACDKYSWDRIGDYLLDLYEKKFASLEMK